MISLDTLRADADAIARQLPGLALNAEAADVTHPGSAGRKRAGSGEDFWQYRRYAQTDAADRIDWRRSARGDEYFVRETELETARTLLFWVDPSPGFDWTSDNSRITKADRARTIMLAFASIAAKAGERVGVLNAGRKASLGKSAADRLAEDLLATRSDNLAAPRANAMAIVASDFYDPMMQWQARLSPLAARCKTGVILAISDPVELTFPFSGRTCLSRPGTGLQRLLGRAETVREHYLQRLAEHEAGLEHLAEDMGWALIRHSTDMSALRGAAALQFALEQFGVRL